MGGNSRDIPAWNSHPHCDGEGAELPPINATAPSLSQPQSIGKAHSIKENLHEYPTDPGSGNKRSSREKKETKNQWWNPLGSRRDHPGEGEAKKSPLLSRISFLLLESLGKLWDNPAWSSGNAGLGGNSGSLEGPWSEGRPWNISSQTLSSEHPGGSTEPMPAPGFGCSKGGKMLRAGIASSPEHSSTFCGYSKVPQHGAALAPEKEFQSIPRRWSQQEPIQAIPSCIPGVPNWAGTSGAIQHWDPGFSWITAVLRLLGIILQEHPDASRLDY